MFAHRSTPSSRAPTWLRVALLLVPWLSAGCFTPRPPRDVDVRPLTIRVVDAETRRPLPGIPVAYGLDAMKERGRILGIWPQIEPDIGPRLAFKAHGRTDERGEVVFHARSVHLPGNQRIDREYAYVNLDVDRGHRTVGIALDVKGDRCRREPAECAGPVDEVDVFWMVLMSSLADRGDELTNPVPTHRGAVVVSDEWPPNQGQRDWTDPDDRFRVLWNPESLKKGSDVVEVTLERYVPEPALEARIADARTALASDRVDRRASWSAVARDARSLALRASGSAERRSSFREQEREAYRALTKADPENPDWFVELAKTFTHDADRVAPLREGVARFPRDFRLQRMLGSALCATRAYPEGVEHLEEAERLWSGDPKDYAVYSVRSDIASCEFDGSR